MSAPAKSPSSEQPETAFAPAAPEATADEARAIGIAFVRIAAARRRDKLDLQCEGSLLAPAHLTERHMTVVGYLAHEGPLTVGELAERLGVTMTTASLVATELEEAQLIERVRDPADRRRVQLQLTAAQARVVEQIIARRTAPLRRVLASLTQVERDAFVKALTMFADELERQASGA